MLRMLLLSGILTLVCCTTKRPQEIPSVTDTSAHSGIRIILKHYYEDMSKRDWKAYRRYFWDNATITTVWQQPGDSTTTLDITTIEDFIRETPNGPDSQPIFEEHMLRSRLDVKGNIAIAWADYEANFGTSDSLMHWKGTDVFTFMRHDDDWKIVSLTFETE